MEEFQAMMRLFKGVNLSKCESHNYDKEVNESLYNKAIKYGILFDKSDMPLTEDLVSSAIELYGVDAEKLNATFHKSFQTVIDSSYETLVLQQIVHYITTYGFETLGIYDKDTVYIPKEQLDIPELSEDIQLTVIHYYTEEQLSEKLMSLLSSGVALSKATIKDIFILSEYILDLEHNIENIKNKEVKLGMYKKYNLVPTECNSFLRYMIYALTGDTCFIKSKDTIEKLKRADSDKIYNLLKNYLTTPAKYRKLSSIFLRNKVIFFALKRKSGEEYSKEINHMINKLSKLAKTYNEPSDVPLLDRLTGIKDLNILQLVKPLIIKELHKVTIFKHISILNAIRYRFNEDNITHLYKIRNGKVYVEVDKDEKVANKDVLQELYNVCYTDLLNKLSHLKGKSVYIPDNVNYAAPTSEKKFCGNIPFGSFIQANRDTNLIVGIHWNNLDEADTYYSRVDLDIHAQNKYEQYGWNTGYKSKEYDIVYSGDVTDAPKPNGATEVFLISKKCDAKSFLLTVNKYTSNFQDVNFDIIIATCDEDEVSKNYTINPNKIIQIVKDKFEKVSADNQYTNQKTLGLVEINESNLKFYFNDFSLGSSIITIQDNITKGVYDYMNTYKESQLMLRQILQDCEDVIIVNQPETFELEEVTIINSEGNPEVLYRKIAKQCDYDLSLQNINKSSIINMLTGK